jgi:hypothetical protein
LFFLWNFISHGMHTKVGPIIEIAYGYVVFPEGLRLLAQTTQRTRSSNIRQRPSQLSKQWLIGTAASK